jgi:hypothetical protein
VEAAVVASLVCAALGWRRRSVGMVHAAAALLGLAVQMHATAIFYLPVVMLAYAAAGARGVRLAMHVAIAVGLVALYFVPLAFAADSQYAKLVAVAGRLGTSAGSWSIADALTVVATAGVDVPLAIGETYAAAAGVPMWAWAGALGAIALVAMVGLAAGVATNHGGMRWPIVALAIAWAIAWNAATGARTFTSFYLAYFALPLNAMLAGRGCISRSPRRGGRGVRAAWSRSSPSRRASGSRRSERGASGSRRCWSRSCRRSRTCAIRSRCRSGPRS